MTKSMVDNSGMGNCMYYAYAISLMYHLRNKGKKDVAERIFQRLGIVAADQERLFYILGNEVNKPFTPTHISRIIEPILGPALRIYAARETCRKFEESPKDSALFTSANYGMLFLFKKTLKQKGSPALEVLDTKDDKADFESAEIYRVNGIWKAMESFLTVHYDEIINKYNAELATHPDWDKTKKRLCLEEIISQYTIKFFTDEGKKPLKAYEAHLSTDSQWGTEESLVRLHESLQGETRERDNSGAVSIKYDTPMTLHIYRQGRLGYETSKEPDIVLNNSFNVHWTSLVDTRYFKVDNLSDNDIVNKKNILLDLTGFNACLQKILEKAEDLKNNGYGEAHKEALTLHKAIKTAKETFLKEDDSDVNDFAKKCERILSDLPTTELKKHRGIKGTFSQILNCLYLLIIFDFPNLFNGNFSVINPLPTDSFSRVSQLKASVQDIKTETCRGETLQSDDAAGPEL